MNDVGERVNAWVYDETAALLARRASWPVILGGDHSVPFGAIRAYAEKYPGLGILHLDAHADLRDAYEGFTWSHASIFNNVMTQDSPASDGSCRSACATSARPSGR